MDGSIPAQCPLGREGQVEALFTEIEDVLLGLVALQLICNDCDHLSAMLQAASLGGFVGSSGVAGDQDQILESCLTAYLLGECQVLFCEIPAPHQGDGRL